MASLAHGYDLPVGSRFSSQTDLATAEILEVDLAAHKGVRLEIPRASLGAYLKAQRDTSGDVLVCGLLTSFGLLT